MIIADSREPQQILKKIKSRMKDEVKVDTLAWGDYLVVGDRFKMVIERKNVFDLIASIKDKRIWKQIDGMRQYGDDWIAVILIEGNKWRVIKSGRATYPQFIGIKASLLTTPGIKIIQVDDRDELIDLLQNLNKRAGNPPREITWTTIKKKGRSNLDVAKDVLLTFNGIGAVKADDILKNERNLISLFRKTKKKLMEQYGNVGEHIYDVLHEAFNDE